MPFCITIFVSTDDSTERALFGLASTGEPVALADVLYRALSRVQLVRLLKKIQRRDDPFDSRASPSPPHLRLFSPLYRNCIAFLPMAQTY